jgi:hypothetical protein
MQTPSQTPTPSTSRFPLALSFVEDMEVEALSSSVSIVAPPAMSHVLLSDSLPLVRIVPILNQCPDDARSVALSCAVRVLDRDSRDAASARAAFVALAPGSDVALQLQCDANSSVHVPPRALTLYAGGTFGALSVRGHIECHLASTSSGSSGAVSPAATAASVRVARGVLPMTTAATMWPVWEDALVFYSTGRVRSGRAGVTANLTTELLRAAEEYSSEASAAATASSAATGRVTSTCSSSSGSSNGGLCDAAGVNCSGIITATSPLPLLLQAALDNSLAVLAVAQTWCSQLPSTAPSASGSGSSSSPLSSFSVTLTAATVIVLRAAVVPGRRAFGGNTTASLGLGACTILTVSPDGDWLVLRTPDPAAVCSGSGPCGYVRFVVSSGGGIAAAGSVSGNAVSAAQQSQFRSATLACPPFCPGSGGHYRYPRSWGRRHRALQQWRRR